MRGVLRLRICPPQFPIAKDHQATFNQSILTNHLRTVGLSMNEEETIALWERGKEAWNKWAQEMLSKRSELEKEGEWQLDYKPTGEEHPQNSLTEDWLDRATAIFSTKRFARKFSESTSFSGYHFPGPAIFCKARFLKTTDFHYSVFEGSVDFSDAKFTQEVSFFSSEFKNHVLFEGVRFENSVYFAHTTCENTVDFLASTFCGTLACIGCKFDGELSFGLCRFQSRVDLKQTNFREEVDFREVTFDADIDFLNSCFEDYATFKSVEFRKAARFDNTTFKGIADFQESQFKGSTDFQSVTFEESGLFGSAIFTKPTRFTDAVFQGAASFNSAQIGQAFDLSGAQFYEVPDFRQAHFEEAPLFDNVCITRHNFEYSRANNDLKHEFTAKYRALKRLAIQGHDHKHEVEFFAEELRSKRLMVDKRWRWDWILSGIFQLTSDYGRSILRPFVFWLLVVGLSATTYLLTAKQSATNVPLQCVKNDGWQWVSAIQLAIGKGLLFPGVADRTLIMQAYDCLYGSTIPTLTSAVLGLQTLVSSALLFLILLGIRNRFKLK